MDFHDVLDLAEFLQTGLDVLVRGTQTNNCHQTKPKRTRIDPRAVAFNDTCFFEALHPLRDGWLRQSNRATDFGQRYARVHLQSLQDLKILAVEAAGTRTIQAKPPSFLEVIGKRASMPMTCHAPRQQVASQCGSRL